MTSWCHPAARAALPSMAQTLTYDDSDLYLTFKSERKQGFVVDWWDNLGDIQHTPIGHMDANTWSQAVLEGFTVYYCRKLYERHCDTLPETFSEELKVALQNCAPTDDESFHGDFGQH